MRVHEAATKKRSMTRHVPYEPKKHQTRAIVKGDLPVKTSSK